MAVNLVQMLCPERHCILAVAYDPEQGTFVQACEELEDIIQNANMNRWCAICGSRDLRFEEGTMPYKTLAEALPNLLANEQKNIESRRLLDAMGGTYEPGCFDVDKIIKETRRHWR